MENEDGGIDHTSNEENHAWPFGDRELILWINGYACYTQSWIHNICRTNHYYVSWSYTYVLIRITKFLKV